MQILYNLPHNITSGEKIMTSFVMVILAIVVLVALYVIGAYNKGIKLRNLVREAFSTMDV